MVTNTITKKTRGFSYIEVMIALALFAVALLAIIPMLSQAGRNMIFAEASYASHLQAQRTMLVVREALADGRNPQAAATGYAAGRFEFSVWIFGQGAQEFHTVNIPDANAAVTGINATMANQASTIIVVVWSDEGLLAGRAIGVLHR